MVRWVVGPILHGGPIELFLIPEQDVLRGKSVRSWCDGSSDRSFIVDPLSYFSSQSKMYSVVRVFAHGAMGLRIDPSWWTH